MAPRVRFVVPAGVCRVRVEAAGASGGLQGAAGTPGIGARIPATLHVSPAETLLVYVGGQGEAALGATPGRGGWNGGGDGALRSTAPTDSRAAPAPVAEARATFGAAQGGSRTASWSPAVAAGAEAAASSARTG
jgi:glycine rich protein